MRSKVRARSSTNDVSFFFISVSDVSSNATDNNQSGIRQGVIRTIFRSLHPEQLSHPQAQGHITRRPAVQESFQNTSGENLMVGGVFPKLPQHASIAHAKESASDSGGS